MKNLASDLNVRMEDRLYWSLPAKLRQKLWRPLAEEVYQNFATNYSVVSYESLREKHRK